MDASGKPVSEPPADDVALVPSWLNSGRRVPRLVVRPLQAFLETEYGGGLILLVCAVTALGWANSPWSASYERVWSTTLSIRLGDWTLAHDLRHWINEGLMTVFFFVVGLEIKRELVNGELRDRRIAALPAMAALGGMIVPACIYVAFNHHGVALRGWGIPMATDIAFAIAVLSIVGRRLPPGLKAFLLALAIIDDIGAIAVIAIFYSGHIAWQSLVAAGWTIAFIWVLRRLSVRWGFVYVLLGLATWFFTLQSGVHATISGVALGLITPTVASQRPRAVTREARHIADLTADDPSPPDADAPHWLRLGSLSRQAVSPLGRLEHLLHPWSSYVIVPIFALANAGVRITGGGLASSLTHPVALGVIAGLVVGKPLGIMAGAWVGAHSGLTRLPAGVGWWTLAGVGAIAGIGFTVSLFIADLAFGPTMGSAAKLGILTGSLAAGLVGSAIVLRGSGSHLTRAVFGGGRPGN
jgi:Na+:H+ antiporter, NhaA family